MISKRTALRLIFLLWICLITSSFLQAAPQISYTVSMDEPHTHYFDVQMKVSGYKKQYIDFKMPVWTPGSYLIREYARNVEAFSAKNSKGQALKWEKVNKNTWRVSSNSADEITVNYKVYAFEISVRTPFLDASHGYIQPAAVFMFVKELMATPATVTIKPYKEWNQISTGLSAAATDKFVLKSPNYDVLVDSPIEVGTHKIMEFTVQNIPHRVAMYGEGNYDEKRLLADMKTIVEEVTGIFGEIPYEHYTFIVHNLQSGGGGLEHLNSTTLQTGRWNYGSEAGYSGFLSLVAHEYFHLYNVKRIRPKALGPFDYENENYTTLLWVSEGITSYYDDYLLRRVGLSSPDEYLYTATGNIGTIENAPGNKVQSAAESSFDTWIKYYRPNENSNNTSISYYTKGAILGMLLDLEILNNTQGQKSFDDVLRLLYNEYFKKQKRGFTEAEMQAAVEKVAGKSLNDFFQKYVYGTEPIDYNQYLGYVGLKLINAGEGKNEPYLGANTSNTNGKLMVTSVMRGTTAYESGLNVNDEILAIDNYRVNDDLNRIMATKKVGDKINILINRAGILQTLETVVLKNPNISYRMQRVANATPQQEALLAKWLHM
ncbi:PDZ domain-containing protein [Rhodocytophaga aerolata]|uniref:PDZ domain-containing protein n=1 Tax=Rhodocytophaga aerolata TaxID=455078 RepID=A0ABT8R7G3_9BACT|nr:PDZ domain-containing protein [Rhodocytophaga aerolata]MDO1448041.1 PDZ domain-containing protein [Rhodocytophaga aerolata]